MILNISELAAETGLSPSFFETTLQRYEFIPFQLKTKGKCLKYKVNFNFIKTLQNEINNKIKTCKIHRLRNFKDAWLKLEIMKYDKRKLQKNIIKVK